MATKKKTATKSSASGKRIATEISFKGKSYNPGDEADLAAVLPAADIERLLAKGSITGRWNMRDAPEPEEAVEVEATDPEAPVAE